jgi:hypothetical protein
MATLERRSFSVSFAPYSERSRQKPKRARGRCRFTQRDVTRARKADPNATIRIETDGSMVLVPGKPEPTIDAPPQQTNASEWD